MAHVTSVVVMGVAVVTHRYSDGFPFTNQWVVPYSPLLCLKYGCHINVEIASAISSVKYLFKYVYKGNDHSKSILHGPNKHMDEIQDYLDRRYI